MDFIGPKNLRSDSWEAKIHRDPGFTIGVTVGLRMLAFWRGDLQKMETVVVLDVVPDFLDVDWSFLKVGYCGY